MEVVDEFDIRCISVNQAYLDLTGLTEEQLIGKDIWEILPNQASTFAYSRYQEVLQTKKIIKYQEKVTLKNGEIIVETRLHPIFNNEGNITHLLGVSQDITDRKMMENRLEEDITSRLREQAALIEREQRYRTLTDLCPTGSWSFQKVRLLGQMIKFLSYMVRIVPKMSDFISVFDTSEKVYKL